MLSGYNLDDLLGGPLNSLERQTRASIRNHLKQFEQSLRSANGPVFVSIGENCGAGTKLRMIGENFLGSSFFDNLVTPAESFVSIIRSRFSNILSLKNLEVRRWENNDSVYDIEHGIFYHHYFHLPQPGKGKQRDDGSGKRRIDDSDIPLFLSSVRSQFEYLAEKFTILLRSDLEKVLVIRLVNGDPVRQIFVNAIKTALDDFEAANYRIAVVHSKEIHHEMAGIYDGVPHHLIKETGERWGCDADWKAFVSVEKARSGR